MIKLRKHNERGLTQTPWLTSYHSFSFADYFSKEWHHFSHLRVINQDIVAPHQGFGMHSHANMEILTIMLKGTLTHRDSLGHEQRLPAGEIQLMRAGTGIMHSEMNNENIPAELLQIWIYPNTENLPPSYQQTRIPPLKSNEWLTLVSRADANTLHIEQNAEVSMADLSAGTSELSLNTQYEYWLQIIKGKLNVNDQELTPGDGLAITQESLLKFNCHTQSQVLLFNFW
jgi:quercetin 2,3-dioxygenase